VSVFKCWDADGQGPDGAKEIEADDARDAALSFAESAYYGNDYPEEQNVAVLLPNGTVRIFTVESEQEVTFSAFVDHGFATLAEFEASRRGKEAQP